MGRGFGGKGRAAPGIAGGAIASPHAKAGPASARAGERLSTCSTTAGGETAEANPVSTGALAVPIDAADASPAMLGRGPGALSRVAAGFRRKLAAGAPLTDTAPAGPKLAGDALADTGPAAAAVPGALAAGTAPGATFPPRAAISPPAGTAVALRPRATGFCASTAPPAAPAARQAGRASSGAACGTGNSTGPVSPNGSASRAR